MNAKQYLEQGVQAVHAYVSPQWKFDHGEVVEYVGERNDLEGPYEAVRFQPASAINPLRSTNTYLLLDDAENPETFSEAFTREVEGVVREYDIISAEDQV